MKKLLPQLFHVTKAGVYGNEIPAFFCPEQTGMSIEPPSFLGLAKVGTHPAIALVQEQQQAMHKTIKIRRIDSRTIKTRRREAQLTDSFGEALYLGLAPQPGREQ
ncbi:hypothetical protein J3Q04_21030 [Pseudomonas sp. D4-21]|uniref:hypothetical protein n=1 Tax=unclassified Pseudomonas TaxID=196821 RepID=UPI003DA9AB03